MTNNIILKSDRAGERLDAFLGSRLSDYSRNFWQNKIFSGEVLVNGEREKPSYKLKSGDQIEINLQEDAGEIDQLAAKDIPLEIIYEDDEVIVINKSAGLVVHPAHSHDDDTLVNALIAHFPKIKEAVFEENNPVSTLRPGLVHRLDKDTSGVMIVAKTGRAIHSLARQIQNRTIQKLYLALLSGCPKNESGIIENYLGRHPRDRKIFTILPKEKGRIAISKYQVLKYFTTKSGKRLCLVQFDIKTGRTHQIRVHAKHLGHPIIGDLTYFNKESLQLTRELNVKRQLLHAQSLSITLPGENKQSAFTAPLPADFQAILDKLTV